MFTLFVIVIVVVVVGTLVCVIQCHRRRSNAAQDEILENEGAMEPVEEEAAVEQHGNGGDKNEGVVGNEIEDQRNERGHGEDERNEEQGDENEEAEDQDVADEQEAVLVDGERNEGLPDNDRVNEIIANHLELAVADNH